MPKRLFTFLFIFSIIFIFTACNNKNNDTSTDTNKNSKENSTVVATSEAPSVIDGIYNGNGIKLKVPDGYVLYDEDDKEVWFFEKTHYNMLRLNIEHTEKTNNDLTEANIKSDLHENEELISSEKSSIAGIEGIYYVYKVNIDNNSSSSEGSISNETENNESERNNYYTIHQYSIIYNAKYISIAFSTEGKDITDIINSVLESVVLN